MVRHMRPLAIGFLLFIKALPALAEDLATPPVEQKAPAAPTLVSRQETFGAVIVPATLPAGSNAAYGFVGVQELGGGYRQGIGPMELEVRATLNYLKLALSADVRMKASLFKDDRFEVAPNLGIGVLYDTGSRYFDNANFEFFGLRPRAGVVATMRVTDTVVALATADVPLAFALQPGGGWHFNPLAGGGAEIYVGEDLSVLVLGQLGADTIKEPIGVPQSRLGYQLTLGLGYRLF
jgi:hypothetical protein